MPNPVVGGARDRSHLSSDSKKLDESKSLLADTGEEASARRRTGQGESTAAPRMEPPPPRAIEGGGSMTRPTVGAASNPAGSGPAANVSRAKDGISERAAAAYSIGSDGLPQYKGTTSWDQDRNHQNIKEQVAAGCDYMWNTNFDKTPGLNPDQRKMMQSIQDRIHKDFGSQADFTRFKWGQAFIESGNGTGFNVKNGSGGGPQQASGLYQMVPAHMNAQQNPGSGFQFTQKQVFDPTVATVASEVRTQWFAEQGWSKGNPYGAYHGIGSQYPDTAKAYGDMMKQHGDWTWTPGMGVQGDQSTRMWGLDPRALQGRSSG